MLDVPHFELQFWNFPSYHEGFRVPSKPKHYLELEHVQHCDTRSSNLIAEMALCIQAEMVLYVDAAISGENRLLLAKPAAPSFQQ